MRALRFLPQRCSLQGTDCETGREWHATTGFVVRVSEAEAAKLLAHYPGYWRDEGEREEPRWAGPQPNVIRIGQP